MKNWKNQYPLNTLKGETRKEFEEFIKEIICDVCDEILSFAQISSNAEIVRKINEVKENL